MCVGHEERVTGERRTRNTACPASHWLNTHKKAKTAGWYFITWPVQDLNVFAFDQFQGELREKLRRAQSEEEKEALVREYSEKMSKVQEDIEQQKQRKLRDVRKLLKEERVRRKKELYKYVLQSFVCIFSLGFPSSNNLVIALARES